MIVSGSCPELLIAQYATFVAQMIAVLLPGPPIPSFVQQVRDEAHPSVCRE